MRSSSRYISVGGNRHPSAADCHPVTGLVAFGANQNVALWNPSSLEQHGIQQLLYGHTDIVTAVAFFPLFDGQHTVLVSGSVDKTIRIWKLRRTKVCSVRVLGRHGSSINCLACSSTSSLIASGSADATVKLWQLNDIQGDIAVELSQIIETRPKFFPLALAIHDVGQSGDVLLAIAGTRSNVEIHIRAASSKFDHVASLPGHEGWIRSLAISRESTRPNSDLMLASASQDKYIRLWRIATRHKKIAIGEDGTMDLFDSSLSNKRHLLHGSHETHFLTFEALLLGHEDWVYSLSWRLQEQTPSLQLLSASADNSVAIWEPEPNSDIWVCSARLGEISLQKGSTTATGSTGGFWNSLWSPCGTEIISLVGTGSWRRWKKTSCESHWLQTTGISGHIKAATGLSWAENGNYLLSTSSDQTTRLHAQWKRSNTLSWHEFGRPQIHGYDLNCVASIKRNQFISGADEKLLRVFDEPWETAELLANLCDIDRPADGPLPETASIPVLGLSNKTTGNSEQSVSTTYGVQGQPSLASNIDSPTSRHYLSPPTEDSLARLTLWPEREKLYGHGHEISALSVSHNGALVSTSCKASALEHAVIRLYSTRTWREIKPALSAHSLTVTALSFSPDDQFLLSVGRDRQWALFGLVDEATSEYVLKHRDPKGHSRMILDACWAPSTAGYVFATAGRDKAVKIWRLGQQGVRCEITVVVGAPVTALAMNPVLENACILLSAGTEQGDVQLYRINLAESMVNFSETLRTGYGQFNAVNHLEWRPFNSRRQALDGGELAIAGQDGSIEIVEAELDSMVSNERDGSVT